MKVLLTIVALLVLKVGYGQDIAALDKLLEKSDNSKDFILSLPPEFRSHYVLLYEGHAGTEATVTSPRMIFYNTSTYIAVGEGDVEIMEWDSSKKEYDFYRYEPKPGKSYKKVNIDVQKDCIRCHTQGEAIWEDYATWCGVYGGTNDDTPSEAEKYWLAQYSKEFKSVFPLEELTAEREKFKSNPDPCQPGRSHELHGGQALGNVIGYRQLEKITHKVRSSEVYQSDPVAIQKAFCASSVFNSIATLEVGQSESFIALVDELTDFLAPSEEQRKKLLQEMKEFSSEWEALLRNKYKFRGEELEYELAKDGYAYAIPFLQRKVLYRLGLSEPDINTGHNRPDPGKLSKALNPRCARPIFNTKNIRNGHSGEYPKISSGFGSSNGEERLSAILAGDLGQDLETHHLSLNDKGTMTLKDPDSNKVRSFCKKLIEGEIVQSGCNSPKGKKSLSFGDQLWNLSQEEAKRRECEGKRKPVSDPWEEMGDDATQDAKRLIDSFFQK